MPLRNRQSRRGPLPQPRGPLPREVIAGSVPPPMIREDLQSAETPLTAMFAPADFLPFGFATIYAGGALSINNGEHAWYGLQSVDSFFGLGQEFAVHGYEVWMGSPECAKTAASRVGGNDGTSGTGTEVNFGPASGQPSCRWGTGLGTGCTLAIGVNLPSVVGEWTSAPCDAPHVVSWASGTPVTERRITSRTTSQVLYVPFPPGNLSGTNYQFAYRNNKDSPLNLEVRSGQRLDVALVVDGNLATNGTGFPESGYLVGVCYGRLLLSLRRRAGYRTL